MEGDDVTNGDKRLTHNILQALVKQDKYATLTAAARILFAEAAQENDPGFKKRLLILAGKIQALETVQ